jgi:hypothetical protein
MENLMQAPDIAAVVAEDVQDPPDYEPPDIELQMEGLVHNIDRLENPLILRGSRTIVQVGNLHWVPATRTLAVISQNNLVGTGSIFSFPPSLPGRVVSYSFSSRGLPPNTFYLRETFSVSRTTAYFFEFNPKNAAISISSNLLSSTITFGEVSDAQAWWSWLQSLCRHMSSFFAKREKTRKWGFSF